MFNKIFWAFYGLFLLAIGSNATAGLIRADMSGPTAGGTTDFWGVEFISGTGWIESVTFDLSPLGTEGYFDFDGTGNYGLVTYPVLGATNGLSHGNITWMMSNFQGINHPRVLTFHFTPGAFEVGDFFRFSADVDLPDSGWELAGSSFSTVLGNDPTPLSGTFVPTAVTDVSIAELATPSSVPEPTSILLLLLGLPLAALMRGARGFRV